MAKANVRRLIIRDWMSLARDKRQSIEQAISYSESAAQRHQLPRRRSTPEATIMRWLTPRVGRSF
jgi:hypothetical protein